MGLDFNNSDAHWSYTGFGRFRERLAEHEGFDLDQMAGFGGERDWSTVATDLKPLLHHSDCDGELTPEECALVGPRLYGIAMTWPEDDRDRRNALLLAESMVECAESGESLEFC
jgi:hypothetical protein